ncbi:MAG: sodium-translocating pyrophosphatase, partial [Planctomycetota bacterium]
MNSFLHKLKPVFKNSRVSIVMILLMLTILIIGISRSGLFSHNVQAQTALKTSAEKPMFELGESTPKDRPLFELESPTQKTMGDTS